jgi:hypothetical protein
MATTVLRNIDLLAGEEIVRSDSLEGYGPWSDRGALDGARGVLVAVLLSVAAFWLPIAIALRLFG